jgi:aminopeptidase-like protein
MANDDMAGVAVLVRLLQWLSGQDPEYTYRLVVGPEHLGADFYLRDRTREELESMVCGVFAEMPATGAPIKLASTFLGDQPIDRAFRNAARSLGADHVLVPWRRGAGNDETVWEAPGYEVPFVEVSRCESIYEPFRAYHTDLDTPDSLDAPQLDEFLRVLQTTIETLESNARPRRRFDGLVCLSNPQYGLYVERPDPSVEKELPPDADDWGYLLDSLLRYLDGTMTVLDIAERHELPFAAVLDYLRRFEAKGLVELEPAPVDRVEISRGAEEVAHA